MPSPVKPDRLRKLLFGSEDESTFAVLDGASVPDLLPALVQAKEEWACLYRGALDPDLAEVAPYLVKLREKSELTDWILTEGWGNHWGVFAITQVGLEALRRHLRRFLRVKDPDGNVLYFRYYDPRVLPVYLPTCHRTEISYIFGPIRRFILEDQVPGRAVVLEHDSKRVKPRFEPLI